MTNLLGTQTLTGKIAVVTGASRGIGRAIALRLAADGARVMLTARDAGKLKAAVDEIKAAGGAAVSCALDLREAPAADQLVAATLKAFGGLDIIVNNAGATKRGDFFTLTHEDFQDGFALKFFGAVRLTRAAWPQLKSRGGSVVNIAGAGGRTPGAEFTIGGSVNAALLSFTKAMADVGIRDRVQVNTLNPGLILTDRLRLRLEGIMKTDGVDQAAAIQKIVAATHTNGIGQPEDIAALVAFIVGPSGRFLHGSLIDIDGGMTKTL